MKKVSKKKTKSKIDESRLSLLTDYDGSDVSGWLVSRKYNGWRATYQKGDGLRTRNGQLIVMPDAMAEELHAHTPDGVMVDGELTLEIDGVEKPTLISRLASSPDAPEWKDAKFRPFFGLSGSDNPCRTIIYERLRERYCYLTWVVPVQQFKYGLVKWTEPFEHFSFKDVIGLAKIQICMGWEGIVLTNPESVYTQGRNKDMMRIKASILKRLAARNPQ